MVRQQNTLPGTILSVAGDRIALLPNGEEIPKGYADYEGQHINYQFKFHPMNKGRTGFGVNS
jgi:hypothetical protein